MEAAVNERPIPTGEGLTFEKVWAMFQETGREIREIQKETDRKMQEYAEQQRKESVKREKEYDRIFKENTRKIREMQEETARQMKETDKKIGELGNRFGELAEHLVAPGIAERFNTLGYHFDAVSPGGQKIQNEKGMVTAEIDILLENGDCIIAAEVKAKPNMQDIKDHVKRLGVLRKHRNSKNDMRTIFGAIAGAVYRSEVKKATINAGFFVLEQSGDTMKMDIPNGFVPREY